MVIGERFAWAHLPKAAGTATQEMLGAVPGLVVFQMPIDSNDKHDPFTAHVEAVDGKLRVMNIRRLPSLVLSHAHHRAAEGVWPDYEPLPMPTVAEMTDSSAPDDMLRWMTGGDQMPVDRWLRQEYLPEDVMALMAELGVAPKVARRAVGSVRFVGKPYDHDVANRFGASDVRRMYERNPGWAEVEQRVYGGVHELVAA